MSSTIGKLSTKIPFVANGIKGWNAGFPKQFIDICKMTQTELKTYVVNQLQKNYDNVEVSDGFVYARGHDVCVTAHLDTVHKETVKSIYGFLTEDKQHAISSPQGIGGDDRCGVYMVLQMVELGLHPTVLFCEDEEIGGVGSEKFIVEKPVDELSDMKFIIELDRANANDLVYYNDDNKEFHDWCAKITGYEESTGSFSDISHLCPAYGVSGVNISCGYYNAHTLNEYVVLEEMTMSLSTAMTLILASAEVEQFKYVETQRYYGFNYGYYGGISGFGNYIDPDKVGLSVYYYVADSDREKSVFITGKNETDCWFQFFTDNPTVCYNDVVDWEVW